MHNQVDKTLLFLYFSGRVTAEQKSQIALWLDKDPCNGAFFYRCLEEWEREQQLLHLNSEFDFVKLTSRIEATEPLGRRGMEQLRQTLLPGTEPE